MSVQKNEKPLVSIISVYYNRACFVRDSIQSLIKQSYNNLEIILVDDGSSDNTLDELCFFKFDPRVKIITHSNMGFTKSIKKAVEEVATAEYIAIHGSGDYSHPDRIEKQVYFLHEKEEYSVCGCLNNNIDSSSGDVLDIHSFYFKDIEKKHLYDATPFTHGSVMFKREDYFSVGGYDPELEICQDWDLWLRFIDNGFKIGYLSNLLYSRYERSGSVSNTSDVKSFKYVEAIKRIHFSQESGRAAVIKELKKNVGYLSLCQKKKYRKQKSRQVVRFFISDLHDEYDKTIIFLNQHGGLTIEAKLLIFFLRVISIFGIRKRKVLPLLRAIKNRKSF